MTDAPRRSAAALSGGPRFAFAILFVVLALIAAGCGNQAVVPSSGPTPSATPTAHAGSSGGPSASPKADSGAIALTAFIALVTKPGFRYQATFTGQSRHSTVILPVRKGLLQVSGDDVLVRATFTFPPAERYTVEHRYVDGKGWIRYDPRLAWQRLPFRPSDTMAAFASIHGKADVTSLGPVTSGGKTYYQVSFRSAIMNPLMIPAGNLTDTALTTPKLTLLIDASRHARRHRRAMEAMLHVLFAGEDELHRTSDYPGSEYRGLDEVGMDAPTEGSA